MAEQLDFFGSPEPLVAPPEAAWPEGFKYAPDVITPEAERALLDTIPQLPFREFEFHGHLGRRRTVSFGWSYDFATEKLQPAPLIPEFLLPVRVAAAVFAGVLPESLQQVLVSEYGAHAGIGWHRDKAVFGEVVGISLLSPCKFRLRRRVGAGWDRITVDAEPRSGYLLSGPSRTQWEHSIPEVTQTRYSITFRSLDPQRFRGF